MAKSKKADADNALAPVVGIEMLAIHELVNSPTNPRKTYSVPELEELARSIKDHGLINPITVRPVFENESSNKSLPPGILHYEVVAGNRRFKAAQIADLEHVPCIVRELTDDQVLDIQIDENLHRQDVPPLEEADAFRSFMESKRISIAELAARVNKSATYIYKRIRLTNLSDTYRPHLESGALPVTTAEIIASYPTEAQDAIYKSVQYKEGDRVIFYDSRNVRSRLENQTCTNLRKAFFPLDRADLQPGLQACTNCEKNTAVATLLFPDGADAPRCTDKSCWKVKEAVWMALAIQEWKAHCKHSGTEETYADLYYYSYDKKPYDNVFTGSEKILGRFDYEVVEETTPGALHVMFIGGSSWNEEDNARNFTTGYVLMKVRNGVSVDWEMDRILSDDSLTQDEKDFKVNLLIADREIKKELQRYEQEQKVFRRELIVQANNIKPAADAELVRLMLYTYLLDQDNFTRNCWHDVFSVEAKEWRPDSFLTDNSDNGEWNAKAVEAWFSVLNETNKDTTPFDVWNDVTTDEERNAFVNECLGNATADRIMEMLATFALYRIHDKLGDWRQPIKSEPVVRFAKHIGLPVDVIMEEVKRKLEAEKQDDPDDEDENDYYLDNEDDE